MTEYFNSVRPDHVYPVTVKVYPERENISGNELFNRLHDIFDDKKFDSSDQFRQYCASITYPQHIRDIGGSTLSCYHNGLIIHFGIIVPYEARICYSHR
jgi:hypothetical protein